MELIENFRDLGIQVDLKLKFRAHTNTLTKKAYHVLGLFKCKDPGIIVRLYTTLVRPMIENNDVFWGPTYILDNQKLERINVKQPE